MALPRKNRLSLNRDITRIIKTGTRVILPPFSLRWAAGKTIDWRCAIVISSRLIRRATWRNELRRLVTKVLQEQRGNIPRWDLVFTLTQPILDKLSKESKGKIKQTIKTFFVKP